MLGMTSNSQQAIVTNQNTNWNSSWTSPVHKWQIMVSWDGMVWERLMDLYVFCGSLFCLGAVCRPYMLVPKKKVRNPLKLHQHGGVTWQWLLSSHTMAYLRRRHLFNASQVSNAFCSPYQTEIDANRFSDVFCSPLLRHCTNLKMNPNQFTNWGRYIWTNLWFMWCHKPLIYMNLRFLSSCPSLFSAIKKAFNTIKYIFDLRVNLINFLINSIIEPIEHSFKMEIHLILNFTWSFKFFCGNFQSKWM